MKKGKSVKLNTSNYFKSVYGTVDAKNLKSIYINIQSWVSPKKELENWTSIVGILNREIKHTVLDSIDENVFSNKSIVDLDLRTSGIVLGKKSFLNLEINLFTEKDSDFKSSKLKNSVKKIVKNVFETNMKCNEYFDFSLTKK